MYLDVKIVGGSSMAPLGPGSVPQFADERGRPFADLLGRVGAGPGHGRRPRLRARHPDPYARRAVAPGQRGRRRLDAARWWRRAARGASDGWRFESGGRPARLAPEPVDVLVSNATLQWVPDHLDLLPEPRGAGAPGAGWFAFQVPGNFGDRATPLRRARRLAYDGATGSAGRGAGVDAPGAYLDRLAALWAARSMRGRRRTCTCCSEDAVVRGSAAPALRPDLPALTGGRRDEFEAEYRAQVAEAYPGQPCGTVLPFRRIFVVARGGAVTAPAPRPARAAPAARTARAGSTARCSA